MKLWAVSNFCRQMKQNLCRCRRNKANKTCANIVKFCVGCRKTCGEKCKICSNGQCNSNGKLTVAAQHRRKSPAHKSSSREAGGKRVAKGQRGEGGAADPKASLAHERVTTLRRVTI